MLETCIRYTGHLAGEYGNSQLLGGVRSRYHGSAQQRLNGSTRCYFFLPRHARLRGIPEQMLCCNANVNVNVRLTGTREIMISMICKVPLKTIQVDNLTRDYQNACRHDASFLTQLEFATHLKIPIRFERSLER